MGKDIYISYRKRDDGSFVAGMLREFLEGQGYSVAERGNKLPGNLDDSDVGIIEVCTDFLLILSEYSLRRI